MEQVLQLIVNGVMAGGVLMLPAIGLSTIFGVRRYMNFAIAGHVTIGAYAGLVANVYWHCPASIAMLFAFLVSGVFGVLCDYLALQPLWRLGFATVSIATIALNFVLEDIARFFFGGDLRSYDVPLLRDIKFGILSLEPQQVTNLGIACVVMATLFVFFLVTSWGKSMRAVGDNPQLADIKGIDPVRMGYIATFVSMGLCGVGGVLLGLETSVDPEMGSRSLLSIFAAVVVGGLGNVPGAVAGALLIGIFEELSLLFFEPVYQSVIGFAVILIVLTVRPQGLLNLHRE